MNMGISFVELSEWTNDKARDYFEAIRWPDGPVCPHCKSESAYKLTPKKESKRPVRKGVYKCKDCRKQFTVTVGTIFEGSHISLKKWLLAIHLMCSSKKGISAHQLHRMLKITYKSAWFMAHRIRFALTQPGFFEKMDGVVEVDETYVGGKSKGKRGRGSENKTPVVSLVQRAGNVRSKMVDRVTAKNLKGYIRENVTKESTIMTDDFPSYKGLENEYAHHHVIQHSKGKYVDGDVHTNTAEGYFSILKRGIVGVYHHVSKQHLPQYLKEFDFRYNFRKVEDEVRTIAAIISTEGKRLAYKKAL